MTLGANKQNSLDSIKYCIENNLYDKEYLIAKITLLPTTYEDVTQADIDVLLALLNPVVV